MSVSVICRQQALACTARSLDLPESDIKAGVSPALVAQAMRRAACILAPCARHEVERSVRETLRHLEISAEALGLLIEDVLESLTVYGDLLEMRATEEDVWASSKFSLRPAAPSFVRREDGSILILGSAGDVITPLPEDLAARVVYQGVLRMLPAVLGEMLTTRLQEFGLIQLEEKAWLRLPKVDTPQRHIDIWLQRLNNAQPSSRPEGLRICTPVRGGTIYRDRWCKPEGRHVGLFVARRPQRFGADIWCLVQLQADASVRLLDLFSPGDTARACDIAWQLQMAMDAVGAQPQAFRSRRHEDKGWIDFFSPVPSWVERKLSLAGRHCKGGGGLFSYEMAATAVDAERTFLREALWLTEVT